MPVEYHVQDIYFAHLHQLKIGVHEARAVHIDAIDNRSPIYYPLSPHIMWIREKYEIMYHFNNNTSLDLVVQSLN